MTCPVQRALKSGDGNGQVTLSSARRSNPRPEDRNLIVAVISGVTLAALAVLLLYLGAEPFFGFAFVVILIAQGEFYHAVHKAGHRPATALGLVGGGLLLAGVFLQGESAAGLVIFMTSLFCFVWFLAMESKVDFAQNIAVTMLGVAYIPLLGSFAGLLAKRPDGRGVTIATLGLVIVYDVVAYLGGRRFGRTPLAPSISPNKTREGALLAAGAVIVAGVLAAPALGPWSRVQAALLGLAIAGAAPAGDLFESLLKRDLGIKDMGRVMPGHGGALDRIDAMLFVFPVSFLSLRLFGL